MAFCPYEWDQKSYDDAVQAEERIRGQLELLREMLGREDANPREVADAFAAIKRYAEFGEFSAAWCEGQA